jgi:hypothetical protein
MGMFDEDRNISEEWKEIIIEWCEPAKIRIGTLNLLIKNLNNQNFLEAKKCLGIKDDYCNYAEEIISLRAGIKSLLAGLVITSAITNVDEIEKYKEKWKKYEYNSINIHHQFVYNQFKMVKTIEHLTGFNNFFRYFLIQLVLNLYEIMNRRIRFTLQFFQEEKVFENELHEAMK